MSHGDVFRNLPTDKANLFNEYFYDQFSDASTFDIDIDWSEDKDFSIASDPLRIQECPLDINPNEACRPVGIDNKELKNVLSAWLNACVWYFS